MNRDQINLIESAENMKLKYETIQNTDDTRSFEEYLEASSLEFLIPESHN